VKVPVAVLLSSDWALDRRVAGAEAVALSKLAHLGFPVPSGFCVVTDKRRRRANKSILDCVESAIASYDSGDMFLVRLLRAEETASAAASSQDYSASDISKRDVASAVIACLQSAKAVQHSVEYLELDGSSSVIRVLVHRQSPAEMVGVAYSCNPITGAEEVIIQLGSDGQSRGESPGFAVPLQGKIEALTANADKPRISPDQLRAVAVLCERARTALDYPCEIKWVVLELQVSIVGVRPIGAQCRITPEDVWTRANIGEVTPDRLTPLSYSAWKKPMELLFRSSFRHFRLPVEKFQFIKSEFGELWYNVGAINHLCSKVGMPPIDLAIGSEPIRQNCHSDAGVHISRMLRHGFGLACAATANVQLHARFSKSKLTLRAMTKKYAERATQSVSPRASLDLAAECYDELEKYVRFYGDATSASFSTLALLQVAASKWLPCDFNIVSQLNCMGAEVATAAEMLEILKRDPKNAELASEFLERFGHRGWQEIEFMNPTWREIGSSLWKTPGIAAEAMAAQRCRRRENARLPEGLKGWRRAVFSELLENANRYSVLRENVKHEFFRPIGAIRQILRGVSCAMASKGSILSERDLYFLDLEELETLISGVSVAELRNLAALRRALWDRRRTKEIDGRATGAIESRRWQGLAASGGRVTGRARVLASPDEMSTVRPGEILVAEALDVGWFPLFSTIGGLVTSMGGVLSHPCVVAREVALPAVVGVRGITELVKTGSWLTVDGDQGTAELVCTPETASAEMENVTL